MFRRRHVLKYNGKAGKYCFRQQQKTLVRLVAKTQKKNVLYITRRIKESTKKFYIKLATLYGVGGVHYIINCIFAGFPYNVIGFLCWPLCARAPYILFAALPVRKKPPFPARCESRDELLFLSIPKHRRFSKVEARNTRTEAPPNQ